VVFVKIVAKRIENDRAEPPSVGVFVSAQLLGRRQRGLQCRCFPRTMPPEALNIPTTSPYVWKCT